MHRGHYLKVVGVYNLQREADPTFRVANQVGN